MAHLGFEDLLPTVEATPEAAEPDAAAEQLSGLAVAGAEQLPPVAVPEGDGADFFENEGGWLGGPTCLFRQVFDCSKFVVHPKT